MDVQGALGLNDDVPNRFTDIRVTFTVEGDASERSCARSSAARHARSAVFDTLTTGVPVHVDVVTP